MSLSRARGIVPFMRSKARKIHDERDARRCLRAAEGAGQRPRDWARANGIDARSLNLWRVNLGRQSEEAGPTAKLVELVAVRSERTDEGAAPEGARYVVDLGGARLEFGDDASPATLRRVLEVLRAC